MRDTIFVIDDDELSVELIKLIYGDGAYKIESCSNGKEALAYLTKNYKNVAIILLDLVMPEVDGNVLLRVLNKKGITDIIPVIIMTAENDSRKIAECFKYGAADIVEKPFLPVVARGRIDNTIRLNESKTELKETINKQTREIKDQYKKLDEYNERIMEVLSSVVEFRNLEPNNHVKRIMKMSRIISTMLMKLFPNKYDLTAKKIELIEAASALHDIGMIAIPDTILLKPGRLSADEYEVIKSHTTMGCEVLTLFEDFQNKEYIETAYNIIRHHHERYDGKGYPDNLYGDDIPIEAQIISIVDTFDALVSDKVQRDGYSFDQAFSMITRGECGVFSEDILAAFTKSRSLIEKTDEYVEKK